MYKPTVIVQKDLTVTAAGTTTVGSLAILFRVLRMRSCAAGG